MLNESQITEEFRKSGIVKRWFLATRPRTLTISFVPLFFGTAFAIKEGYSLNWIILFSLLLSVPCIQIGMNFINDALDSDKGKKINKKLKLQRAHLLTNRQFLFGGVCFFGLSLLFGFPLILVGGWLFALLLSLSIALGYLYTGGPYPLSYLGISELFILIFYGWVATAASYYLQTSQITLPILIAGTQIGLLAIVPHAINNLRDYQEDGWVNKKTLAVRFGPNFARWEIAFCSLFPYILGLYWIKLENSLMTFLPFISLPIVLQNLRSIWNTDPGPHFNTLLARSALCQLIFTLLLAVGMFYS